ncbi:MAG: hypothetical protein Q7T00_06845 [Rugosibacter sp.]|nr:hypothetical protein [Rugosibacter sp.]
MWISVQEHPGQGRYSSRPAPWDASVSDGNHFPLGMALTAEKSALAIRRATETVSSVRLLADAW